MANYTYECPAGHVIKKRRGIAERDAPVVCKCGARMTRDVIEREGAVLTSPTHVSTITFIRSRFENNGGDNLRVVGRVRVDGHDNEFRNPGRSDVCAEDGAEVDLKRTKMKHDKG